MLYGLILLMKKRASVKSKRRVSASRKSVSRTKSSWFDSLRDTVTRRREFVFLALVLVAGMLIFDVIGYDYTGLVTENNAVSGAQTAGIPDDAIRSIASTFQSIFKLVFSGFLSPILNIFENNEIIATRLTLFFVLLFLIHPILKGIFKVKEGGNKVAANVTALLISLLGIGLLPAEFVKRLSVSIPALLVVLFIIAVLFGMFKWKATSKGEHFIKGLMAIVSLLILSYIVQGLSIGVSALSGAIWLVVGFVFLILMYFFFYGVFYKPFTDLSGTSSFKESAEKVADVRKDVREGREVLAQSKEEGVASKIKRDAPKTIRNAEKAVYEFLSKYVQTDLGNEKRTRAVSARLDEVIGLLRHNTDPRITVQIDEIEARLRDFQDICNTVRGAPPANAAEIGNATRYLSAIRANLNTLYTLVRT
mgnify:CR=1 FL=1